MYEPTGVSPSKPASARAEGAATILTATGLPLAIPAHRHRCLHTDHAAARPANRGSHACGDSGSADDSLQPEPQARTPDKIHSLAYAHRAGRNPEGQSP
jgi:hypothetical protein